MRHGVDFNPSTIEVGNNNAGFGLCQWSYGRRTSIENYAASQGANPDDITLQLDFLWYEMSGENPEIKGQFFTPYSFEEFKAITDLGEATDYFCDAFERPNAALAHKDRRKSNSQMYYDEYQGTFSGNYTATSANAGISSFTTYDLTDSELTQIANLCQQEQGSAKGAAAEASLMANRFELYGKNFGTGKAGLLNYVRNSGWFAKAGYYMDNGPQGNKNALKEEVKEAVRGVLVEGKRTLPGYVDEHDYRGDISSITNDGVSISIDERDKFVKDKTIIKNTMGATYTFYCFPDDDGDPFGYTSVEKKQEIGDFCYDFESGAAIGGVNGSKVPKAAKNVNFPYSLIKNGFHEVIVNRYDMQKYSLDTKYKDYVEYTRKSVGVVQQTKIETIHPDGTIYTSYSLSSVSCDSDTEVSSAQKSSRDSGSGIDPKLEEYVNESISITNQYYLQKAVTFDMIYENEFKYTKYNDNDTVARVNSDTETVTGRAPYKERFDEAGHRFTNTDLASAGSIYGIKAKYGASCALTKSYGTTESTNESSGIITRKTVEVYNVTGQTFIEHDGEEISLNRTWSDKLSQSKSDSSQVDYEDMIEFNENKENKGNRSTITKKEFESSKDNEYKMYKQMSKEGNLNLIDMMNSNPKLISTYLSDKSKQSEYMGYTKEDDLLMSYTQLRNLVEKTKNEDGVVPYAYFVSLDYQTGASNQAGPNDAQSIKLDPSEGFGWPVDLSDNDGARVINYIYPETEAYGGFHGGIDIAAGKGENRIIAAKDGKIVEINQLKDGYGNTVVIQHDGNYYTRYSHLKSISDTLTLNDEINKGDFIGIMGSSGDAKKVHLGYEMYKGSKSLSSRIDPLNSYTTSPEYGSIDPATIKNAPSGYKFDSEKGYCPVGSTSTGMVEGKVNIVLIAGHTVGGRSRVSSGYYESEETRNFVIAMANAINRYGMNAVIQNRVDSGNKDIYVPDKYCENGLLWGSHSILSDGTYSNYKNYDHAIEIHFNAFDGTAYGAEAITHNLNYSTAVDLKLVECIAKYSKSHALRHGGVVKWGGGTLGTTSNFAALGVPCTYIEVEFYDNKEAMDHIVQYYDEIADEMARVLKVTYDN